MRFEDTFIGRPNTIRTHRSLFKNHIEPHVETGTEADLIKLIKIWEEAGLAQTTKQTLIRLAARYIKFLSGVEIPTARLLRTLGHAEQQRQVLVLNETEARNLMDMCKRIEPKYYPVLLLGLHAGLRRGEIFGLRCGDIDFLKGRIRIAHSYDGPTKNGKTRFVPMSSELSHTLMGARNFLLRPVDERVFERMDPNPTLRRLCYAANVPTLHFHDLRHTFATMALESGKSPRKVQALLGHSSVVTTLSIYWHLTNDDESVDEFLP